MKDILIITHGTGSSDPDNWHKERVKVLRTAYNGFHGSGAFHQRFKVVPVYYNDIFEKYHKKWIENTAGFLSEIKSDPAFKNFAGKEATTAHLKGISDTAKELKDQYTNGLPIWRSIFNAALYRYSILVRSEVNVRLATAFNDQVLKKRDDADFRKVDFSFIAHSMGTAVVHNTLHALYQKDPDATDLSGGPQALDQDTNLNGNFLRPDDVNPRAIVMLANVSRLLQLPGMSTKVYKTRVRPGFLPALCRTYINARHVYDPFVWYKPFHPDPHIFTRNHPNPDEVYKHLRPSAITHVNTHAATHYLANPEVHVPIFQALDGKYSINETKIKKARQQYNDSTLSDNLDDLRDALEQLQSAPLQGFKGLINVIKAFQNIVSTH